MTTSKTYGLLVGLVAGALISCTGSSDAAGGPTTVEFKALQDQVAALTARVTTVEGQFAGVDAQLQALETLPGTTAELQAALAEIRASIRDTVRLRPAAALAGAKGGARAASAQAALPAEVGTLIGLTPGDVPAFAATGISLFSTTGYMYSLPSAGSSVWANPVSAIHYASADCSGQGYVSEGDVSELGASKGTVFGIQGPESDQAQWFFRVPRGAAAVDFSFSSKRTNTAFCQAVGGSGRGYAVQGNDPVVTGVPSGPFSSAVDVGPTG